MARYSMLMWKGAPAFTGHPPFPVHPTENDNLLLQVNSDKLHEFLCRIVFVFAASIISGEPPLKEACNMENWSMMRDAGPITMRGFWPFGIHVKGSSTIYYACYMIDKRCKNCILLYTKLFEVRGSRRGVVHYTLPRKGQWQMRNGSSTFSATWKCAVSI